MTELHILKCVRTMLTLICEIWMFSLLFFRMAIGGKYYVFTATGFKLFVSNVNCGFGVHAAKRISNKFVSRLLSEFWTLKGISTWWLYSMKLHLCLFVLLLKGSALEGTPSSRVIFWCQEKTRQAVMSFDRPIRFSYALQLHIHTPKADI